MQDSLTALLSQIQAGDEQALLALHAQYANAVYSLAYRVLNLPQDAEEVTQDVFLRLWHKADSYDAQKGSFITWLLTITRRLAIDRLRSKATRLTQALISMDEEPYLWENTLLQEDVSELQRNLLSALAQLPPEQQQALQLAYFQGMSHQDIAEYLGKPLGTVKSYIRLGMQKLRAIWVADNGQET